MVFFCFQHLKYLCYSIPILNLNPIWIFVWSHYVFVSILAAHRFCCFCSSVWLNRRELWLEYHKELDLITLLHVSIDSKNHILSNTEEVDIFLEKEDYGKQVVGKLVADRVVVVEFDYMDHFFWELLRDVILTLYFFFIVRVEVSKFPIMPFSFNPVRVQHLF